MTHLLYLTAEAYEALELAIRGLEVSARKVLLGDNEARDHARETVAQAFRVRQLLQENIIIIESEQSTLETAGNNLAI